MARREGEGIYRRVAIRMHGDEKIRQLKRPPPGGMALWWNLIAGEPTGIIPGLMKIGESAFAELLEWPIEGFREAFAEVEGQGLVEADWKARLVWVKNAVRHNIPASPNVVLSWRDAWDLLPECELKNTARRHIGAFLRDYSEPYGKAFDKACPKASAKALANQEQEQDQEQEKKPLSAAPTVLGSSEGDQVFAEWKRVFGKTAGAIFTSEREKKVKARLKEGYTLERLFKAIRGCKSSPHHMGQNDTGTVYDDLELICRDGKHVETFEGFADRAAAGVPASKPQRAGGLVPASPREEHEAEQRAALARRGGP